MAHSKGELEVTILANKYTQAKPHTYAVLVSATGEALETAMFPTSPTGIARVTAWMRRRAAEG